MITISLCMIVRNEEAVLSRCLDSFKDIADEIIIVDTGSTDHTKDVAQTYTHYVYDFPWINDFSAARNRAFSKASMDYCMWADADDILPESQRDKILVLKGLLSVDDAPDIVMMKYATSYDENGLPNFLYYRERLIKNDNSRTWHGRVHETIPLTGNINYQDIYIEHHSYKTSYSDRNLKIYESMLEDGETLNVRDMFYYGRELYYHGHYTRALDILTAFLAMPGAFAENQVDACRIAAYSCYPLKQCKKALHFLLKGLSYRIPGGEICCDLGRHYMDSNDYEQAVFWYLSALHAPKKIENGGFINDECYGYLPCVQLSVCYDRMEQKENALRYHTLAGVYNPKGELYLKNQAYFLNS